MKPILFNTEMVRAVLDDRKTVTRRKIKGLNPNAEFIGWQIDSGNEKSYSVCRFETGDDVQYFKPKYLIGDILYVKETFALGKIAFGEEIEGVDIAYLSQCDNEKSIIPKEYCLREEIDIENVIWKSSIHMSKKYARLFLRVTDVRVERLQDVDNDNGPNCQVVKEGFRFLNDFIAVWNKTINKNELSKDGWEANPYVFVYEFEVINKEEAMKESEEK